VLVTLGGGDPDNQTLKVVQALQRVDVDELEAVVVVGASNPHFRELQSAVRNSRFAIRLVRNVSNMPELMAWADVAVLAGGSTCWEMAFMGLPTVVLVLAENQQGIAAGLDEAGVVLNLGSYTEVSIAQVANTLVGLLEDQGLRRQMSQRGKELVDGLGSERAVKFLQTQSYSNLASN
jgi:spore coat polysaccharide biosynthesis predicted glycosyltransferase SpsG